MTQSSTNLFWRDEENVDGGPAVHSEVSLGAVRLLEAVQHRRVHLLSVGAGLRVEKKWLKVDLIKSHFVVKST